MNCIIKYDIDRLALGVFNGKKILKDDKIELCDISNELFASFRTPYDVSPSIWKIETLSNFFNKFPEEKYSSLENNEIAQNYIRNFNCYGLQKNNNIKLIYHRGFCFSEDLSFLHITINGEFLPQECYFDLKNVFLEIVEKYNLNFIKYKNLNFVMNKNII